VIRRAVLYLPAADDARAALLEVAGRPVAFRMVVAALRAGVEIVDVPAKWRDTPLGHAIGASPRASRGVQWLEAAAPGPIGPVLWLPATLLAPTAAIARLAGATPVAAVGEPDTDPAPVVVGDTAWTRALWGELLSGAPLGDALARALKTRGLALVRAPGLVRVRDAESAARAEAILYSGLGSAIDTRLDTVFHRRLSRLVSRRAVGWGVTPNQISMASLLVGLVGAWWLSRATLAGALIGFGLYAAAVVLDHADGEVARLALAESQLGEWLDVVVDTAVHAAVVLAMGVGTQTLGGGHATLVGALAALGIVLSAAAAKTAPATGTSVGRWLEGLGTRDGFYVMLVMFVVALTLWPTALPGLMMVVAAGANAYWISRLAYRLLGFADTDPRR
jgi:phosphatidylglycerophosphate synthase